MRTQAVAHVRAAVRAIAEKDPAKGLALNEMDDVPMFGAAVGDERSVQRSVQVALIGRYYERIADHAVNTGERVDDMVRGIHEGTPPLR